MGTEYEKAISFAELYKGLQKSQRGVMWKDSVAGYSINGLKNTYKLRQSLLDGTYEISKYQQFTLHEPKEREILATRIKDRQFQRSLCDNVLYPQITRHFVAENCACQRGRGPDYAFSKVKACLRRYYLENGAEGWVFKGDVKKYFPSTQHNVACQKLQEAVDDREASAEACCIITSFAEPVLIKKLQEIGYDDDESERLGHAVAKELVKIRRASLLSPSDVENLKGAASAKLSKVLPFDFVEWALNEEYIGIGLGSQPSQLTQLLMLNELDHFIKERLHVKYYVRYMDDFILIHPDKAYLKYCWGEIEKKVGELGLLLNEKTELYPLRQGVKLLKWRFILTPKTGKIIMKMNDKKITAEKRKLRKLKAKMENGERTMDDIRESYHSWLANAERGQTKSVVKSMRTYYYKLFHEEAPRRNGNYRKQGRETGKGDCVRGSGESRTA